YRSAIVWLLATRYGNLRCN
ncbi:carbohydrate binding domain protein, partial [Vibrio parahaemolyticus VP2007-007]